jgi:DNA polymerase IV
MRSYGIRANSYSGAIGFNRQDLPAVSFRFITSAHTNIDDYVFRACMEKVMPLIEKAVEKQIEIRNLVLATHQIDKTRQMNLFFSDEKEHVARCRAIDEIRNRFGHQYITRANTLHRVKGNRHFLERNG